jgi:hypothetical protein
VADEAVAQGTTSELQPALLTAVTNGLKERWQRMVEAKSHANDSVAQGRAFVATYTELLHFIEAAGVGPDTH